MADAAIVDLAAGEGRGPLWGTATEELNATLLAWPAGGGTPAQVNAERDVVLVVVAGGGTVELAGAPHAVSAPAAVVVPKGRSFRVEAGSGGIRYLSLHRRREPLQVGPRGPRP